MKYSPDELASAYLDGEATQNERALVEGDQALLARVEELRSVRAQLRGPVAVPSAATRDAAIAAALDTAGGARRRHDGASGHRRRVFLAGIGVAAAVVIALGIAATVSRSPSTPTAGRETTATTLAAAAPAIASVAGPATASGTASPAPAAPTTAAPPASTVARAPSAAAPAGAAADTASSVPVADLGPLSDAASVRAALGSGAAAAVSTTDPCSLAPARLAGRARWNGVSAYVYVQDDRAVIVATADCSRLVEVPLS